MKLLNRKSLYLLLGGLLFLCGFGSAFLFNLLPDKPLAASNQSKTANCDLANIRMQGFSFARPLLYVEQQCETEALIPLKKTLLQKLRQYQSNPDIQNISLYFREMETGNWFGIQEKESYHPGSLLKIPLMMTCLQKAAKDPGFANREFTFDPPADLDLPIQNYKSQSLVKGRKYTLKALLQYMIVYSDNMATWVLKSNLGPLDEENTYIQLGLTPPVRDPSDNLLRSTAKDSAIPLRALYNATFLSKEDSEYALSLLSASDFKQGMLNGLPASTKTVHKFGEWDNGQLYELHETGIIYLNQKTYLLTIMTRGSKREALPALIASITRDLYALIIT